jgi:hypothetical protein
MNGMNLHEKLTMGLFCSKQTPVSSPRLEQIILPSLIQKSALNGEYDITWSPSTIQEAYTCSRKDGGHYQVNSFPLSVLFRRRSQQRGLHGFPVFLSFLFLQNFELICIIIPTNDVCIGGRIFDGCRKFFDLYVDVLEPVLHYISSESLSTNLSRYHSPCP